MAKKICRITVFLMMAILSVTMFISCSDNGIPDGYQIVSCDGDKFLLFVPTQVWMPNTDSGTAGAYYTNNSENTFISVYTVDKEESKLSIEEYASKCDKDYSKKYFEYTREDIGEYKKKLGGQDAYKLVFTASLPYDGKLVEYKVMQVFAKFEENIYILTYGARNDIPEGLEVSPYDSHYEMFAGLEYDNDGNPKGVVPYFRFTSEPYVNKEKKEYPKNVNCPDGMKIVSTNKHYYRFFVPETWISDESTQFAAAYYSESDRSNVSIMVYNESLDGQTVADYWKNLEAKYEANFDSWEILSDKGYDGEEGVITKLGNLNAREYIFTATYGGKTYKIRQLIAIKGGLYYTFTYTSSEELFDSHTDDVNKMIENFKTR